MNWAERLAKRIEDAPAPVPGWSVQWLMFFGAFWLLLTDRPTGGAIFLCSSCVISVIRAIERERRA